MNLAIRKISVISRNPKQQRDSLIQGLRHGLKQNMALTKVDPTCTASEDEGIRVWRDGAWTTWGVDKKKKENDY